MTKGYSQTLAHKNLLWIQIFLAGLTFLHSESIDSKEQEKKRSPQPLSKQATSLSSLPQGASLILNPSQSIVDQIHQGLDRMEKSREHSHAVQQRSASSQAHQNLSPLYTLVVKTQQERSPKGNLELSFHLSLPSAKEGGALPSSVQGPPFLGMALFFHRSCWYLVCQGVKTIDIQVKDPKESPFSLIKSREGDPILKIKGQFQRSPQIFFGASLGIKKGKETIPSQSVSSLPESDPSLRIVFYPLNPLTIGREKGEGKNYKEPWQYETPSRIRWPLEGIFRQSVFIDPETGEEFSVAGESISLSEMGSQGVGFSPSKEFLKSFPRCIPGKYPLFDRPLCWIGGVICPGADHLRIHGVSHGRSSSLHLLIKEASDFSGLILEALPSLYLSPSSPPLRSLPSHKASSSFFDQTGPTPPWLQKILLPSSGPSSSLKHNLARIWFLLTQGKAQETVSLFEATERSYPYVSLISAFQGMKGMAFLLLGQNAAASEIFDKRPFQNPEWDFLAWVARLADRPPLLFLEQVYDKSPRLEDLALLTPSSKERSQQLSQLPDPLRQRLYAQVVRAAVLSQHYPTLETIETPPFEVKDRMAKEFADLGKILLTLRQRGKSDASANKALLSLAALEKRAHHPLIKILCQFYDIQLKVQEKILTPDQELDALNGLRCRWKGEEESYRITSYYLTRLCYWGKYGKALPLFESLLQEYPDLCHREHVQRKATETLLQTLRQCSDPLQRLSWGEAYEKWIPLSAQGDQVMFQAARDLCDLGLVSEGVAHLKKHLQRSFPFSASSTEAPEDLSRKDQFFFELAYAEGKRKNFSECLSWLNQIKEKLPQELEEEKNIMKAKALWSQGHTQQALEDLGESWKERNLKGDFLFQKQDWEKAASVYEGLLAEKQKINTKDQAKLVYHAALAYALCHQREKVEALERTYRSILETSPFHARIQLLMIPSLTSDTLPSQVLDQMKEQLALLKKIVP